MIDLNDDVGHLLSEGRKRQELDQWLDDVDYQSLNSNSYVPTPFSLNFMNFIKMANGTEGESHKTPPVHLKMLDKVTTNNSKVANLCFRGAAKTTLFGEYFFLYLAIFRFIPNFGEVSCAIYVSDSMENGVKSLRKNMEFRYENSEFLKYYLPEAKFTDNYIEFTNIDGEKFGLKMFGAKTGLRGTKIFGKRPPLCVLDDLVSDDDSKSKVSMEAIKDTVYKGVDYALDPVKRKVIFNGTPFNKQDILIEAVESGAWDVNVWPVCERFPCEEKDFAPAWPDRFTYSFVKNQYEQAVLTGKLDSFYQELMLRITSEDERLVQDGDLRWYSRKSLLANAANFNFYITTDFATSKKDTADYSVISVWAYNSNGDWFWVDGVCVRQTMDKNVNDLFRLISEYNQVSQVQSVGVETSGQQGGFIPWLQQEMMNRNIWFNFAYSDKNNSNPGIRPIADKLSRFNLVVPWFKAGKIYFPEEMKATPIMGHFLGQIKLATVNGLKGKDDCIDTISMLAYMKPWKPSASMPTEQKDNQGMWDFEENNATVGRMGSYVV